MGRLHSVGAIAVIAFSGLAVLMSVTAPAKGTPPRLPEIHRVGRWLVDSEGRVVVLHGLNVERKKSPYVPTAFGPADARLLAQDGFTVVRLAILWAGVEPQPGQYDNEYIAKVLRVDTMLSRYGIYTLLDMHQDFWSQEAQSVLGDGAPSWATLGSSVNQDFAAFWSNAKGPGGVGIQTRFVDAWHHIAEALRNHPNVIGIDPLNEPYPGSAYTPPCNDFSRCPAFERGALAKFYGRVTAAIRSAGATQVIFAEGVADSGAPPVLPKLADPQSAFNFHLYCQASQLSSAQVPVGAPSAIAGACAPLNRQRLAWFTGYAERLSEPSFLTEFSCNDVNPDNADMVDLAATTFTSWTAWAYYPKEIGSDCTNQGLLSIYGDPSSVNEEKVEALAVPYATAIAGTPLTTSLNRSARIYRLTYRSTPVPGARLAPGAQTVVFVPTWMYPHGYVVKAHGARVESAANARWLRLASPPGRMLRIVVLPR